MNFEKNVILLFDSLKFDSQRCYISLMITALYFFFFWDEIWQFIYPLTSQICWLYAVSQLNLSYLSLTVTHSQQCQCSRLHSTANTHSVNINLSYWRTYTDCCVKVYYIREKCEIRGFVECYMIPFLTLQRLNK